MGDTSWDARRPFYCDGQPIGSDREWIRQPRGHASILIEPIEPEELSVTPCPFAEDSGSSWGRMSRRLTGAWDEDAALQAEVDKIGQIFNRCAAA